MSQVSGTQSLVKADTSQNFGPSTGNQYIGNLVDFQVTYTNVMPNAVSNVSVISTLPTVGDKQIDSGNRNSQFTVVMTEAATAPEGWSVVYSKDVGTAPDVQKVNN